MKNKQIATLAVIAALSTLAPRVHAADAEVKTHVDVPDSTEVRHHDTDVNVRTDATADQQDKIRHSDKATGIIGMEVRNTENQKLGEIKDLVLDVNSGKVSYAVLAVGGFLGIGEKLIALPPQSLKQATDGEYLILNADKSRIQAAPGFAATAWPGKHDPEINRFWNETATGAPASTESSRRRGEVEVKTDHHKIYTDADKDHDAKVKVDVNK